MMKRVGLLTGLLIGSFLLGMVPTGSAQGETACGANLITCSTTTAMAITPPSTPVKPLGPFITVPITVSYTYTQTASVSLAATPITLKITSAPSWVILTLSPTTVYAPVSQVSGAGAGSSSLVTENVQANLLVSATQDAPAFTQGPVAVQADAAANGALKASSTTNTISVQADFFSIIEASTPQTIQKAKPQQQVTFPITVTNFGNAQTKVEFQTEAQPDKWQVSPPAPVQLAARQTGGTQNTKTANYNVQTPFQNGYLNVVGAITIRLKSNYALDPKVIGDSTIISTLTTTKGFYVPGPEPVIALMAIGVLAVAMRARKPGG